jgi:hypothetical protein
MGVEKMTILVLLFFAHATFAAAVIGARFLARGGTFAASFGIALLLDAMAFAAWGGALVLPDSLPILVTIGAALALVSFVFFLNAGASDMAGSLRMPVVIGGAVFVAATFVAGRYIFPTPKFVSPEGFLFFNLHPFVQLMYVTALVVAAFPAIEKAGTLFSGGMSTLVKFLLTLQVAGTIVLITNSDTASLFVAGLCMGLSHLALWTMLLFRKDIWFG